ncbi:MAG: helix-turn-helix domain-containing protein [Clostridia bacterium]|nr:helix-turn-helix domain-containing protein [Clostridia bacterium]
MNKKEIGEILKKMRLNSGKTQKEVAEIIGRTQQIIGHWETGYSQPDANTLFDLCKIYGTTVDEAFGFTNQNNLGIKKESLEVAKAYENADLQHKNIVRVTLGLNLIDTESDVELSPDLKTS